MTFREKIILAPKKTVYIRVDYTSLLKGRFFMMIAIYPAVSNVITDFTTLRIVMFVNLTDKPLKICKGIRLNIIHKFVETVYFLIDAFKVAIALATTTTTFSEPLS